MKNEKIYQAIEIGKMVNENQKKILELKRSGFMASEISEKLELPESVVRYVYFKRDKLEMM